jgi:hypothetical protein
MEMLTLTVVTYFPTGAGLVVAVACALYVIAAQADFATWRIAIDAATEKAVSSEPHEQRPLLHSV